MVLDIRLKMRRIIVSFVELPSMAFGTFYRHQARIFEDGSTEKHCITYRH